MQSACAILLSVACLVVNIFPHYFINGTIFGKKELLILKFSLQIYLKYFSFYEELSDML